MHGLKGYIYIPFNFVQHYRKENAFKINILIKFYITKQNFHISLQKPNTSLIHEIKRYALHFQNRNFICCQISRCNLRLVYSVFPLGIYFCLNIN